MVDNKEKETKEVKLIGQVTDAQIALWKKQYGDRLYTIEKDGHIGYLRKPDRTIMSFLASLTDMMKWNESLMENCFIGGSEIFKKDDDFFLSACKKLDELVNFGEVELKKI